MRFNQLLGGAHLIHSREVCFIRRLSGGPIL